MTNVISKTIPWATSCRLFEKWRACSRNSLNRPSFDWSQCRVKYAHANSERMSNRFAKIFPSPYRLCPSLSCRSVKTWHRLLSSNSIDSHRVVTRPTPAKVSVSFVSPRKGNGGTSQGLVMARTSDALSENESWSQFEHAVDAAVKSGPKHRPARSLAGTLAERCEKHAQDCASDPLLQPLPLIPLRLLRPRTDD